MVADWDNSLFQVVPFRRSLAINLLRLRTWTMGVIALAFGIEVVSSQLGRVGVISPLIGEILSTTGLSMICLTGVYLIFRLPNRPALKLGIVLASALMLFSQFLAITERLPFLDEMALLGVKSPVHNRVQDLLLLSGLLIMIVVAFLALIEAVAAEMKLQLESRELAQEVEERKRAELALEESREELRDLGLHIETVREEERKRIAREIHDELGQSLTILRLDLSSLENELQHVSSDGTLKLINSMSTAIGETMHSVRKIIAELRPGILDDLGLVPAAEWQAREFERRTAIKTSFHTAGVLVEVSPEKATALFRILQEALTNVARHAEASEVKVSLEFSPEQVLLRVKDNGRGMADGQSKKNSFGLLGVRERVRPHLGSVDIVSSDAGTQLTITLPTA